uniref:Glycine N-acyltransferase-like protein n=1 Tax=Oncorhynchus mykiss TaxID=8022 RepID=A0A8K9WQ30_ONCMY
RTVCEKDSTCIPEGFFYMYPRRVLLPYGFLYGINRSKPNTLEIVNDSRPDFKVIADQTQRALVRSEFMKKVHFFCMDEEILKRMVTEENAISDAVNMKGFTLVQLMMLPDPILLPQLNTGIELRVSFLNESHIDLVRWGLAGCALYVPPGKQLPKQWFLSFSRYVVNRNRGQGLAKALVSSMSRRLYSQGLPVYCFVEEENTLSYNLYNNLVFIEDPQYRATWYQFNY